MSLAIYYADKKPVLIPKHTSLLDATRYMLNNNRYHAVLINGEGKLTGILSIRDVAKAIFVIGEEAVELIEAGRLSQVLENPVYLYSTEDVYYISEKDKISDALKIMIDKNIGSLPIVDSKGKVIGVLEEKQAIKGMPTHTKKNLCEYVTWDLITLEGDDEIIEAIGIMINNNIRRIVIQEDLTSFSMTTLNIVIDYLLSPSSLEKLLEGDESPLFKPVKKVKLKPWVADCTYTLREIASILTFDPLGAALIESDEKIGIITERDLLRALGDHFIEERLNI